MKWPSIPKEMFEELIERFQREGHTQDYIDGAFEGMNFIFQFYISVLTLAENKNRLLEEEYRVADKILT